MRVPRWLLISLALLAACSDDQAPPHGAMDASMSDTMADRSPVSDEGGPADIAPDAAADQGPQDGPPDASSGEDILEEEDIAPPCPASAENTEEACSDGCSNDGDPYVDCQDYQCNCAVVCGGEGCGPCVAGPEDTEQACHDGCSNDGDPWIDCTDRDCDCTRACGGPGCPVCQEGPEDNEAACMDGCSNDGDRYIDCADWDCAATAACGGSAEERGDERCADGLDNDGDGLTDCQDWDCSGDEAVTVCPATVRVATWNIQEVGWRGSAQYEAAKEVLLRINADVVGLNEVDGSSDTASLRDLAVETGYQEVAVTGDTSFGDLRNAFLSRLPILSQTIHTSAALSGDSRANDMSRLLLEIVVDVTGTGRDLTLLVEHWKSGFDDDDQFRRACESYRAAQALKGKDTVMDAYVVMGDMNDQIVDVPHYPEAFWAEPSDLPSSFHLGADLAEVMAQGELMNDPFHYLVGPFLEDGHPRRLNGQDGTRPSSNRRIDYILMSPLLYSGQPPSEIYSSADEGLGQGLPKAGEALQAGTSAEASDHLPVVMDLTIPP